MTASSRPKPVEQPVMNQTGFDWASAMTASLGWKWGRPEFRTMSPESATLAVLMWRAYIQYMKTVASMLQIRNRRVVDLAAKLAAIRHTTKTDAVLSALENELARIEGEKTLAERLKPLQDRIAAVPRTGLEADKDFYDDLSGDS
jgi:antitoxin VapB